MIAIEKVQEFERRIDALEPDTKAKWGKMNATQMLTHMNDAIRIGLGMKPAEDKSNWVMNKLAYPIVVKLFPAFPRNLLTAPEMKQGKLKSGRSGKKVTNPKQAIAIGLSEARKPGAKAPKKKSS